jgi:hypothetical protein
MKIHTEPDEKCAPSKKYTDGSCFTLEALRKIAQRYNKRNPTNKIDLQLSKEQLVRTLEQKLADKCNTDQTCWLRLDFVKELENDDIEENTFLPKGPSKKYEWLSTTHINDVIEQYQKIHKDFEFLGAVPYDFDDLQILGIKTLDFDEKIKNGITKLGMVINLDEHWKNGSHWVGLYTDLNKNQIYFFDSVGKKPLKRIRKFITRIAKHLYTKKYKSRLPVNDVVRIMKMMKGGNTTTINKIIEKYPYLRKLMNFDIRYNHIQHQFNNSECGVYSINFIVRLVCGESFDSVINDITKDEEMNANRKIYFRNVN